MIDKQLRHVRSCYSDAVYPDPANARISLSWCFSHNQEWPLWGELPTTSPPPRLMDQVSALCRRRHLSRRTEKAYRFWIRRYIFFHLKQHPRTLGTQGIAPFVNYLAVDLKVAASTQSQALNAILFLYRDVLEVTVGHLDGLRRVQRSSKLPVVLTVEEVRQTLAKMQGTPRLMAEVLYGSGLRVTECMTLRIKDIDFRTGTITVRSGKGAKDRTTVLPATLTQALQQHLFHVIALYKRDVDRGRGYVPLDVSIVFMADSYQGGGACQRAPMLRMGNVRPKTDARELCSKRA